MNNAFIRFSCAAIFFIGWVVAWQQVLYAPYLPGESFTAAVILLIVLLLQYVVLGRQTASRQLPIRLFSKFILLGILLLLVEAAAPLAMGKKMLEKFEIHLLGHQLSSTVIFEFAVLFIVVGVGMTALITFKEPD